MTATAATPERPATAKLVMPRPDAAKHLKSALDRGNDIRAMRIRNGDELDAARGHKLEWTQDANDLLAQMFDNTSVADYFNDWVGKIFPEYAEFGNFVDQFFEEMDHRLGKLRTVLKRIEHAGESSSSSSSGGAPAADADGDESVAAGAAMPDRPESTSTQHQPKSSPHTESAAMGSSHASASSSSSVSAASHNKVLFVSHGPKDPSGEAVLQFMQQLSMAVLEADHTNGLIDTLEARNDTGFVVVMNAADHVENGKATLSENSMFKLGYCAGKLGIKRMCMLHGPTHPSTSGDAHGIPHVGVDPNGGWQLHLARQMKRAGMDVDLNRLA